MQTRTYVISYAQLGQQKNTDTQLTLQIYMCKNVKPTNHVMQNRASQTMNGDTFGDVKQF